MDILETSEERVELLKAGMYGKDIEKLYLESNGFKIVMGSVLIDTNWKDMPNKKC